MPIFIVALWGALIQAVGTLVGKVLISLGIGYVTYSGINALTGWAQDQFLAGMSGLPVMAVGMAHTMKIGVCVSMLLSAVTARLTLAGLSSAGSIKKMVVK
jgi:hypothetical protein